MKKCCVCKDYLLESSFFAHHGTKDGLQNACKNCGKTINRRRDARIRAGEIKLAERQFPDKKMCARCSLVKEKSEFEIYRKCKDGLNPWCRVCKVEYNRDWRHRNLDVVRKRDQKKYAKRKENGGLRKTRLAHYGLTPETFAVLFAKQGNACGICQSLTSGNARDWHIDHDHSCCPPERACDKCRRGILCHLCNVGIGGLGDSAALLVRAIEYLASPPGRNT